MRLIAVIFDLDGTLIKSEKVWAKAFVKVLKSFGIKTDKDPHTRGVSVKTNWEKIIQKFNIKTGKTPDELETLTNIEYEKLISELTLNPGATEFMEWLSGAGIPMALATSTNWGVVEPILKHFEISGFFESTTTGEEVILPKPAPDIYLAAAEKLGVDPIDCLVIEDSATGVEAAKDAGMKIIGVTENEEKEEDLKNADLVVSGFSEITSKAIDAIGQD